MKNLHLYIIVILGLTVTAALAEDAKISFEAKCAVCHGKDGKGDTKPGQKSGVRDFTLAKVQETMKDEAMIKAVKEGVKKGEILKMKAYGDKFSDEEIKSLVKYVRSFKK